jgi:hypothetical protein
MPTNDGKIRMLTLYIPVRADEFAQKVASDVKAGFTERQWNALRTFGVLDARITSVPDPAKPGQFSAILLCTTYRGGKQQYNRFFWSLLRRPFVALAMASTAPPFKLNEQQQQALLGEDESAEALAPLEPLFDDFEKWVLGAELTGAVETPDQPPEPGGFNQFRYPY